MKVLISSAAFVLAFWAGTCVSGELLPFPRQSAQPYNQGYAAPAPSNQNNLYGGLSCAQLDELIQGLQSRVNAAAGGERQHYQGKLNQAYQSKQNCR